MARLALACATLLLGMSGSMAASGGASLAARPFGPLVTATATSTPPSGWEGDRRATQDTGGFGQSETAAGVNPTDPSNAIVVAKDYRGGEGNVRDYIDATTDAGATWFEQPFPYPGPDAPHYSDPTVFFRRDGRAYIVWMGFSNFPNGGLYIAWSDDKGVTWSPPVAATTPTGHYDDKEWLTFDSTGGPHDGTLYLSWVRFGNSEIYACHSTDGGATWSEPVQVSGGAYSINNQDPRPVVLPDGTLVTTFLNNISPGDPGAILVSRSTDGGHTFSPNMPVLTVQQPPYTLPGDNWRLFTFPSLALDPARGWLTLVWNDYRDGDTNGADILTSRSTDGGLTWADPTRLNDDPQGLVRDQWFPEVVASPDGRLTTLWLDRRDDPNNRLYYAYSRTSLDGGLTWQPSVRIAGAPSDPNSQIPPGSDGIGDYIGLSAGNGVVWASWVDARNGDQDIYAARELFAPQPGPTLTPTSAASPTVTSTPIPPSPTSTAAPGTTTPTLAATAAPSRTATNQPPATNTPTPIVSITATSQPTSTPTYPATATPTDSPTSTPCSISFSDVPTDAYFYVPVRELFCAGVISGYPDGTFRPYANTTRGQAVKIVVLADRLAGVAGTTQTFSDVPLEAPFFSYIEVASANGVVSGVPCGGVGEPCDPANRPYFRPGQSVTRGQLAKLVAIAAAWPLVAPARSTFSDVQPGSPFYLYIEAAASRNVLGGYSCGSPEPCDAEFRPYFRPANPATRGQLAKIVYNARAGR